MLVLTAPASFGHSDCERIVGAALAQPVLAITSLAYVAAGMAVLCWAMRVRAAPLAGAAGVALVAVGAGSFAYHGPQPSWAELAHNWPIVAAGAVYAAGMARSGRRQWRTWAAAAGVFALGLAAYAAGRSASPLCRPDSFWQYHGAWHVLSAAAAGWAARAMAPAPPAVGRSRCG